MEDFQVGPPLPTPPGLLVAMATVDHPQPPRVRAETHLEPQTRPHPSLWNQHQLKCKAIHTVSHTEADYSHLGRDILSQEPSTYSYSQLIQGRLCLTPRQGRWRDDVVMDT